MFASLMGAAAAGDAALAPVGVGALTTVPRRGGMAGGGPPGETMVVGVVAVAVVLVAVTGDAAGSVTGGDCSAILGGDGDGAGIVYGSTGPATLMRLFCWTVRMPRELRPRTHRMHSSIVGARSSTK